LTVSLGEKKLQTTIDDLIISTYYDLIELKLKNGRAVHIPVPIFIKKLEGKGLHVIQILTILLKLPHGRIRDNEFFRCELCGDKSFYRICRWCLEDYYYEEEQLNELEEWRSYQEWKNKVKEKFISHVAKYYREYMLSPFFTPSLMAYST